MQVPASTPAGSHTVTLHRTDGAGESLASAALTVTAIPSEGAATPGAATPGTTGNLVTTGISSVLWTASGAATLALLLGALLVMRHTRTRHSH